MRMIDAQRLHQRQRVTQANLQEEVQNQAVQVAPSQTGYKEK